MAPIPPFLVRVATIWLTQALTTRLSRSPTFLRAVDRLIHEFDHLPSRLEGKSTPPYRGPPLFDPRTGSPIARGQEQIEEMWERDRGEPHDWIDPFSTSQQPQQEGQQETPQPFSKEAYRDAERRTQHSANRTSNGDRSDQSESVSPSAETAQRPPKQPQESPSERWKREMREIQDKIRGGGGTT